MDKETLSNYGWIVILVLILAVLLAFATPFGTFVADGFKATYTGLFQTGTSALDVGLSAVGVKNVLDCGHERNEAGDHTQKECGHYNCDDTNSGCVTAVCGVPGHWSGDGMDHTTVVNHTASKYETPHTYACQCTGWIIPEGGTYTMKYAINGKSEYIEGEALPCGYKTVQGDIYQDNDYTYKYNMYYGFPRGNGASYNWYGDSNQKGWGVRVNDTTKVSYSTLQSDVNNMPVTAMDFTFYNCVNMVIAPEIPQYITILRDTFLGCTALEVAPEIPYGVVNMTDTFARCTSLKIASEIPNTVQRMLATFSNCNSLVTAPTIPSSANNIELLFYGCTSLTGAIEINTENVTNTSYSTEGSCIHMFSNVDFEAQGITLTGTSTKLDYIGLNGDGKNYCTECNGCCKGGH